MKNEKIKKFELKVASLILEDKNRIVNEVHLHLKNFERIDFISFNYREPYKGELKNKIFLTYSDHYKGNSGISLSVCSLKQPHTSQNDRGYIKGVAIDLDGYLILRSATSLKNNMNIARIYQPKFRKSKNSEMYIAACRGIIEKSIVEMNNYILGQVRVLNKKLNEMTGCSLLHYIENI